MPVIQIVGHLTPETFKETFDPLQHLLSGAHDRAGLIIDARAMTGYDPITRDLFVSWHQDHRNLLTRVAVVTEKPLWRMVIAAVSLAASVEMKAFATIEQASSWAGLTA